MRPTIALAALLTALGLPAAAGAQTTTLDDGPVRLPFPSRRRRCCSAARLMGQRAARLHQTVTKAQRTQRARKAAEARWAKSKRK